MSALRSKADILQHDCPVRYVPLADKPSTRRLDESGAAASPYAALPSKNAAHIEMLVLHDDPKREYAYGPRETWPLSSATPHSFSASLAA
jgi:hypothetical protein